MIAEYKYYTLYKKQTTQFEDHSKYSPAYVQ